MEDEPVAPFGPMGLGDEAHEGAFDFDGIGFFGEGEALGEASDMGIDDNADRLLEGVTEDDVGGFASDTAEVGEGIHIGGDLAVVMEEKIEGGFADAAGFAAEKAGGLDQRFEFCRVGGCHLGGGGEALEEGRGDHIDPAIGALGAEDGGDEEFERVAVEEFAMGVGVGFVEGCGDGEDALLSGFVRFGRHGSGWLRAKHTGTLAFW